MFRDKNRMPFMDAKDVESTIALFGSVVLIAAMSLLFWFITP
jgi:hypothetical protein